MTQTTDQTLVLAAQRGREEFAEGWGLDECPYPGDGEMRTAWINAWCDADEAANGKA
jgi:ribosome modulation factor